MIEEQFGAGEPQAEGEPDRSLTAALAPWSSRAAMATTERARKERGERAREILLLAAEQLFAVRGIEGVSLREIAAAAGSRNNNAVRYHFGTKAELLHALFRFRVRQMEERRGAMLEAARALGRLDDADTLIDILCLPQLDLVDSEGAHPYASFVSQFALRHWTQPGNRIWSAEGGTPRHLDTLLRLLRALLPHLPESLARSRIMLCMLMFLNAVVRFDTFRGTDDEISEATITDALAAAKAAFGA